MSAKVGFSPGYDGPAVTLNAVAFCTEGTGSQPLEALESAPFRGRASRSTVAAPMTMTVSSGGGLRNTERIAVRGRRHLV